MEIIKPRQCGSSRVRKAPNALRVRLRVSISLLSETLLVQGAE